MTLSPIDAGRARDLIARFSGLPVLAGPTEATALGNVLIQARAHGAMPSSLEAMRGCIARSMTPRTFEPT